jgi:hypothetical protein
MIYENSIVFSIDFFSFRLLLNGSFAILMALFSPGGGDFLPKEHSIY